jgi:hypothetical protein
LPEVGEQGRTVWASFDWVRRADPDTALKQQEGLAELVDAQNLVVISSSRRPRSTRP